MIIFTSSSIHCNIMKQTGTLLLLAIMMLACNQQSGQKENTDQDSIISATIEELTGQPEEFRDKQVAISGMVTHVCRHGGQKCFVLAGDGETQIRMVPGPGIDEFGIELEGSDVAFRGIFRILGSVEATAHVEDHESKAHHATEMAHTEAEKADIFIEVSEFREVAL